MLPGEAVRAARVHHRARLPGLGLRVGWYGGAQARLVWVGPGGGPAPPRRAGAATRTVRADWERNHGGRTDGWPEGAYLLRLDAESGRQRYVPLVVRSASAAGATLLMHAAGDLAGVQPLGRLQPLRGQGRLVRQSRR